MLTHRQFHMWNINFKNEGSPELTFNQQNMAKVTLSVPKDTEWLLEP